MALTQDVLSRVITFANGKGGVGKTTTSTNFAGLCAAAGWRTLFVEFDPQGDAGDDLGYKRSPENDHGAHMFEVLDDHKPLQPVLRNVRPNLDVVPMGREALRNIEDVVAGKERRGTEYRLMLAEALAPVGHDYDLIVIDTPPTRPAVLQLVLGATRWLVVPTKSDRSSIGNLAELAAELAEVRHANPHVEVLGVVPFDFDKQATRIQRDAVQDIQDVLDGASMLFHDEEGELITIRHSIAAIDARTAGMLVHEMLPNDGESVEPWLKALQDGRRPERVPGSAGDLANDHLLLTNAILTRIGEHEEATASKAADQGVSA